MALPSLPIPHQLFILKLFPEPPSIILSYLGYLHVILSAFQRLERLSNTIFTPFPEQHHANFPNNTSIMATTTAPPQDLKVDKTADFGDDVKTEDERIDVEAIAELWEKYNLNGTPYVF
ncbi:protein kinase [Histoplasma capsulatum var. duboisii H88]|uniref:Protein kinase n=1 Tax=Ajellomyces capsulatus (strain H88) TaxID=544711 RepID=F0UI78_AJEC8|nr:protein kinase [Histoplasma capsulatum var. duboisii H88]